MIKYYILHKNIRFFIFFLFRFNEVVRTQFIPNLSLSKLLIPNNSPFELPTSGHTYLNSEQNKYKYFEHITVLLIDKITNKRFYY